MRSLKRQTKQPKVRQYHELTQIEQAMQGLAFHIKCLVSDYFGITLAFDAILDDPSNPRERYLRIYNGLSRWDPHYQGALLHLQLTADGYIVIDVLECTDGFTVGVSRRHRRPEPIVRAQSVHQFGGSYTNLNGRSVSPFVSSEYQPLIQETVTETARFFGSTLLWEDDLYLDPEWT